MSRKLVWLSNDGNSHTEILKFLEQQNWSVVATSDVTVLEREVQWSGVCMAVIAGDLGVSGTQQLAAFSKRYSSFPLMFFGCPRTSLLASQDSPWVIDFRANVDEPAFLRELEKFAAYASAEQEKRQYKLLLEKIEKLSDCFDVRDMNMALISVLNFFQTEFQCENVFWFREGEFAKASEKAAKKQPYRFVSLEDLRHSSCPMMASRPFDVGALGDLIQSLTEAMPEGWEKTSSSLEREALTQRYLLVPVLERESGEIAGHFLLLNGVPVQDSWLAQALEKVQKMVSRQIVHCLRFESVKSMSYTDHLTPLYNQRFLPLVLDREVARVERYGSFFSVLFLDIDHFKSVNDSHGHLVGSGIITQLGEVLKGCIRDTDYGFRFGGDEFVLVLVETDVETAEKVAERVRQTVEKHVFSVNHREYKITVSIGVSACPKHARTREEILALADEAMYYGKNTTKNVVYVAS